MSATQSLIAVLLAASLAFGMAETPAIGIVKAKGNIRINDASVYGNGTLFDGNAVETGKAASELLLASGARVVLASNSRSKVYRDRLILEQGSGEMKGAAYRIEACSLRISANPEATARVAVNKANLVQVAALAGPVQVLNSAGALVARILPGTALELNSQGGAAGVSKLAGVLEKKDGKYFLKDETTNVVVELRGAGLDREVGRKVQVAGAAIPGTEVASGASHVIQVSEVHRLAGSVKKKAGAAAAGAAGTGAGAAAGAGTGAAVGVGVGAGAAAGISAGATVAIVGGVAAATVGGLAASGTLTEDKGTTSR